MTGCQPSAQQQVKPGFLLEDLSTARLGLRIQYMECIGRSSSVLPGLFRNPKGPPCVGLFWFVLDCLATYMSQGWTTPKMHLAILWRNLARHLQDQAYVRHLSWVKLVLQTYRDSLKHNQLGQWLIVILAFALPPCTLVLPYCDHDFCICISIYIYVCKYVYTYIYMCLYICM